MRKRHLGKKPLHHYEEIDREIEEILKRDFQFTEEVEGQLFSRNSSHSWYQPEQHIVDETIETLPRFDPPSLETDILGPLYESHIRLTERRDRGQYYTPPEMISFIWDRVGLKESVDFFRRNNGHREAKLILDPATGSGGFLVEAARRLRTGISADHQGIDDLLALREAIGRLCGSEIQPFAHYLAEVNLLIQLTPIISRLSRTPENTPPGFRLSIANRDSLGLHNREKKTRQGIYPNPGDFISDCHEFDVICANPPYIGEKGNRELFRSTLERHPYWREYYRGKMDYLYWFVILGLSKLREGGRLGYVTSSYWPTADGASVMRRFILDHAIVREVIDLGEVSAFEDAPGHHNLIFILERSGSREARASNRMKMARVLRRTTGQEHLSGLISHLGRHIDKENYRDDLIEISRDTKSQGELTEGAWNLTRGSWGFRVTWKKDSRFTPLGDLCYVNQGIISGADRVTIQNIRLLPPETVNRHNIRTGDGIFVLTEEELDSLQLSPGEMSLVKPLCKNSDIKRYRFQPGKALFLIYTTGATQIERYPEIKAHLEKFHPILENKRETREGRLPWYSLHWPRNEAIFQQCKIVTPNRAPRNTFALSLEPLYTMSDVFLITSRDQPESPEYILALLNSSLIEKWLYRYGKGKGLMREYVGTPLSRIPIRRIDFDNKDDARIHHHLERLSGIMGQADSSEINSIQEDIDETVSALYGLKSGDNLVSWERA